MASVLLRFGPTDHGRAVDDDDFETADFEPGYRYEIIEGRVYVSPAPNFAHDWVEDFVAEMLRAYSRAHREIIGRVSTKARVFVPKTPRTTAPEPDIAAYRTRPKNPHHRWQDMAPLLVVEILGDDRFHKDLVRNVDLYLRTPSIEEYWVFDIRNDPERPRLRVHRRQDDQWTVLDFTPDDVYTTPLLPGLSLPVSPIEDV